MRKIRKILFEGVKCEKQREAIPEENRGEEMIFYM
jgi:hypothetical protein